jgi:mannose-6-phosphate isomerase-like protein (cupin superfamily)
VSDAVVIPPGAGDVITDRAGRRVEILSDHDLAHVTWSRYEAAERGPDPHVHRRHADAFFVLTGTLTARVGADGRRVDAAAGSLVVVPPLVIHSFSNEGPGRLCFLNVHAPGGGFARYMRGVRDGRRVAYDIDDPPADGGRDPGSVVAGQAEVVADRDGLYVALLADVDELAVAEVRSAPDGAAAPAHVHREHAEGFWVLEGELTFTLAGDELQAGPGTWVLVPPGTAHTFAVTGPGTARFLDLHAPSRGFGAFVRALHAARDEDELQAARARFDQVLAPPAGAPSRPAKPASGSA